MSTLTERLLGFMFTQAFTSDEEEEQQDSAKEDASKGIGDLETALARCSCPPHPALPSLRRLPLALEPGSAKKMNCPGVSCPCFLRIGCIVHDEQAPPHSSPVEVGVLPREQASLPGLLLLPYLRQLPT